MPRLPEPLLERLASTPQTGDGYWLVVVRLRDGREFGGIGIVDGEIIGPPVPIETREVVAIGLETGEWVHVGSDAGVPDRVPSSPDHPPE